MAGEPHHRAVGPRPPDPAPGSGPVSGEAEGSQPLGDRTNWMVGGRNLPQAILVGLLMAVLFLGSLYWHAAAFTVVVTVATIVAYVEVRGVLRHIGRSVQLPVLLGATLVMLFGAYGAGHTGQLAGVLVLVMAAILWQLFSRGGDKVTQLTTTVFFGLWIGLFASFAVLVVREGGPVAVLAVIGAAILTDIGGYAFGVAFGRHKLAPLISPNKTWEGLVGGVAVATLAGTFLLPLLEGGFDHLAGAVVGLSCGLAAFTGDLAESMIKRELGVKDLGGVLPGHGGVLDRVDGILMALPVGYVVVELLV